MANMVSKLSVRSLGDPRKVIVNAPENETRWLHGTIIGEASGISKRTSPDGEKIHEGLAGVFEAIPTDAANEAQTSGVLYLPEGMAENFIKPFRGDNALSAMQLAIEVYVVRAKNPQGYSWELKPLLAEEGGHDPLVALKAKLGDKLKALPAPQGKPTETAAPSRKK